VQKENANIRRTNRNSKKRGVIRGGRKRSPLASLINSVPRQVKLKSDLYQEEELKGEPD
jgi:hypothetical protein